MEKGFIAAEVEKGLAAEVEKGLAAEVEKVRKNVRKKFYPKTQHTVSDKTQRN